MYRIRIKVLESILSPMIVCFGNPEYQVPFWNKLQGYGLKSSDFEESKGCSRRVFSHWKNFLLERKMIRIPKAKRTPRKNSSRHTFNNQRYAITPIGICYFSSLLNEIEPHYGTNIIKILSYHSLDYLHLEWKDICKIVGKKEAHQILKKVCDAIEISDVDEWIQIKLNYRSRREISYEFFKYIINQNQVRLELAEGYYSDEPDVNQDDPVPTRIIDDDSFFRYVAEFILEAFCYSIIENCHWKLRIKFQKSEEAKLTNKEKSDYKNMVTKYKTMLENIPDGMHVIAYNFFGQNIFGILKQEEKLSNKVSDYFNNKIMPKYEHNFVEDDGKPYTVFSIEKFKKLS